MAFTGVAQVVQVANDLCLIKGLSLAAGAAGTISLSQGAGEVTLPVGFDPTPAPGVALVDALQVEITAVGAVALVAPLSLRIQKAGLPILITITNDDGGNATTDLEIYVRSSN